MCIFVSDAVCGVIIYRVRIRRLRRLLSAAVLPVFRSLRVPVRAVALRCSLYNRPVLRSRLPGSSTRLPARLRACLPGSPSRLPDRLRACRSACLPAHNACFTASCVYG